MEELKEILLIAQVPPIVLIIILGFWYLRSKQTYELKAQEIENHRQETADELVRQRMKDDFERDKFRHELELASAESARSMAETDRIREQNTSRLIEAQAQSQLDHKETVRAIEENNASRRERLEIEAKQAEILQALVNAQNALETHTLGSLDKAVVTITSHIDDGNRKVETIFASIGRDLNASAKGMGDVEDVIARLDKKTGSLPEAIDAMTIMIKELPEQMRTQLTEEMKKFHEELQGVTTHFQKLLDMLNAEIPPPVPKSDVNVTVNNDLVAPPIPAGNGNGDSPNV